MSGQIAKLFLRGSLVNVTAKNLDETQKIQVNDLMKLVWNDPKLDNAKYKFCQILASTIGGEYTDKEFAMNEVWITLWRTAVDTLFHNPKPQVVNDPIIRKKHFKACIFNYMRQILNENKIPSKLCDKPISGPADTVAREVIAFILDNTPGRKLDYSTSESGNTFYVETNILPLKTIEKIWKLQKEIKSNGIIIDINDTEISITSTGEPKYLTKKVKERVRVNAISLTSADKDDTKNSFQQHCEYNAIRKRKTEVNKMIVDDAVHVLYERLPEQERKVLNLLFFKPKDFMDKYYPRRKKEVRPKEIHIAQWLGMSKDDVIKSVDSIQEQARALDIC